MGCTVTSGGMANSLDQDQTAPKEQSDPGLDTLRRTSVPIFRKKYGRMTERNSFDGIRVNGARNSKERSIEII